ncbi:hypothetical protein L798_05678 [Zootermopsis nevadensis]|uniref:Lipoprotein n=1 Tax=Zootermopsis nevadensis TaxID=136037 RepID=A0A067R9E9_ZOONE|nr:hypothetical protein L798_05678 [Zootermopsis nevadensis]
MREAYRNGSSLLLFVLGTAASVLGTACTAVAFATTATFASGTLAA